METTDDIQSPAQQDAIAEAAVLRQILNLHPAQVTFDELLRDLIAGPGDFAQRDTVERAVRELAGAGLVHRNDAFIVPTRAAVRFDELLDD